MPNAGRAPDLGVRNAGPRIVLVVVVVLVVDFL